MNLETIEKLTKERSELERLEVTKKQAIQECDVLLKKLGNARQELQDIADNKEKLLTETFIDRIERVAEIDNKIIEAKNNLEQLGEYSMAIIERTEKISDNINEHIVKSFQKIDQVLEQTNETEKKWAEAMKTIDDRLDKSEKLLIKNSDTEKKLKEFEKELSKKSKLADEKLEEAKNLVFWHKNPNGKLTI